MSCIGKKHAELPGVSGSTDEHSGFYSKIVKNISYKLQYKPLEQMLLAATDGKPVSDTEKKELEKEYGRYEYYTLEIGIEHFNSEIMKYNLQSAEDYEERVNYYAFQFQNDLSLVVDKDTLPCLSYHFERNYGIAPNARFLLAFNKCDESKKRTFVCNEKYLGNSTVKLAIAPGDLKDIQY
ncbi:MAG: hypothetical protein ACXVP0_11730 [Bacteroidia bacterium]